MADEISASAAEGVNLTADAVEDITSHFCRIDNGVSALYLVIEDLENSFEMASGKVCSVNDLFFERTNALHHLAETIRNDLEKADAIINGEFSMKVERAKRFAARRNRDDGNA